MSKFVDELKKFNLDKDTSVAEKAPIRKAKTQSQRDAENDLYRKTGDLSLYGMQHHFVTMCLANNEQPFTSSRLVSLRRLLS